MKKLRNINTVKLFSFLVIILIFCSCKDSNISENQAKTIEGTNGGNTEKTDLKEPSSPAPTSSESICDIDFSKITIPPLYISLDAGNDVSMFAGQTDQNFRLLPIEPDNLPENAQYDPQTSILTFKPNADQVGKYTVNFKLAECPNSNFTRIAEVIVNDEKYKKEISNPNQPPLISSTDQKDFEVNQEYSFNFSTSDPEGDVVKFAFSADTPSWFKFSVENNVANVTAKPTRLSVGHGSFTVIAYDSKNYATTKEFSYNVLGWKSAEMVGHVASIDALGVYKNDPNIIHILTETGHYSTNDGGKTWEQHMTGLLSALPGYFNALAVSNQNSNIVFGGLAGYFYLTFDGGVTWEQKPNQALHCGVTSILPHPKDSQTVYYAETATEGCCYANFGVVKSVKEGLDLKRITGSDTAGTASEITGAITSLVFADTEGKILLTTVNPVNLAHPTLACRKNYSGIYISKDEGATWNKCGGDFPEGTKFFDVKANTATKELFLATNSGIYYSAPKDLCQRWSIIKSNEAPEFAELVTIDQAGNKTYPSFVNLTLNGDMLFLLVGANEYKLKYSYEKYGYFKGVVLNDGEKRLGALTKIDAPNMMGYIEKLKANEYLLWGNGLYKSTDGGASFQRFEGNGINNYWIRNIAKVPGKNGRIFMSTNLNPPVRVSDDNGLTFYNLDNISNNDLSSFYNKLFTVHADTFGRVFLIAKDEIIVSENSGVTWASLFDAKSNIKEVCPTTTSQENYLKGVRTSPNGTIYVYCARDRIYYRSDNTKPWELFLDTYAKDNKWKWRLTTDENGKILEDQKNERFSGFYSGSRIYDMAICPTNPNVIYVNYSDSGGIAKSTDGGNSFIIIDENGGSQYVPIDNSNVLCAKKPNSNDCALNNDGRRKLNTPVFGLAIDPLSQDCNTIYTATYTRLQAGGCLSKSIDAGETWTCSRNGLVSDDTNINGAIFGVFADPKRTGVVYVGIYPVAGEGFENGLYVSKDGGMSFSPIYMSSFASNTTKSINDLVFDSDNDLIYLGTYSGFYRNNFDLPTQSR